MPSRQSSSVLHRAVGAAFSGLILAGLLLPGTALAGPGSPPSPVDDVISTLKNTPISGNVLTNDDNPGEGTLTVVATGALSPTVGTLVIAANGNYTFTPALNFVGNGATNYSVANDKHTRQADITIHVTDVPHPPVANDDTVTVDEDTATNVSSQVLGNDTDVDGDSLSITAVSNVTGGQASVSGGVLTFTGAADDCGAGHGSFDYTISDGHSGTDVGHVDVNITCVNDEPVAGDDDASGTEDSDVTISDADLLLNDSDADGTPAVTDVGNPSGGTVSLLAGTITFVPDANLCGDDAASFDYTVEDGDSGSTTGTVTIDLTCVNDDPVAGDDDATVTEDTATDVTASLLGNDTDVDTGDTLEVTDVSNATGGSVVLVDGVVTFTPAENLCGDDEGGFDYELSDGTSTDTGHVTVDITCVNDEPVAGDDDASGTEDSDVTISDADLLLNDSDADGTPAVTDVGNPSGGTVSLLAGTITFVPDANLCGDDAASFDYTVEDGDSGSTTGTVTIDLTCVNDDPVAGDDDATVTEDTATDVTASLLGNDTDVDTGDTLEVTDVSNATGGSVVLVDGVVTFTPAENLCGDDEGGFDYELSDGTSTDTGHVTVDITCVNDEPVAGDDDASGTEDTDVTISDADLLLNDSDADGTPAVTDVGNPSGGTVSLLAGTITFVPDANLCGDDAASFDYTVEDGDSGSTTGTVTIDLTCVNDDPVAGDDDATVTEDTATDVTASLLGNDTDVDTGDTLEVTDVSNATGGSVVLVDGVVTFTPAENLCGDDEGGFDYELSDGTSTDTGHVTVDITCVNDEPVAGDDDASGTEDTDVTISDADLLLNDSDADGTPAVTDVGNPSGGTVSLLAGTITFVPDANLCGDDAASFDYTVEDGDSGSTTGTVTIDLTCVNDLPVAVADTASVDANSPFADHDVLDNDSDPDHDPLTIESATVDSAAGTASVVGGMVRFTPKTGFNGQAVITYVISDGTDTASTTLTITVGGDVAGPVVKAATVAFASGRVDQTAPLKITWSATDVPSGVAKYQVQVSIRGAAFKTIYTGTNTSIVKFYPFKERLVFRTRAMDTLGNWSGWVNSAARKIVSYQNTSRYVAYTGTWHQVNQPKSSGKGYAYTTQQGAKVRLTFSGRSVLYVAPKTPTSGKVKVYIDGKLVGRFDLHRSSARVGRIITRATWSAKGTHTIRVVADSGSTKRESFDAFIVLK